MQDCIAFCSKRVSVNSFIITLFHEKKQFLYLHFIHSVSRDGSVDIATRYGLDGPAIESRWGRDFPHLSRPTLKPTQPPIQWVPVLSRGLSGRGVTLTTHPHLVPRSLKSRAIPLLPVWARVACYRVKPYLTLFKSQW